VGDAAVASRVRVVDAEPVGGAEVAEAAGVVEVAGVVAVADVVDGALGPGAAGASAAKSWICTATAKATFVAISLHSERGDQSRRSPTQRPLASLHRIQPAKPFSFRAICTATRLSAVRRNGS
jgi:hypothetical protein